MRNRIKELRLQRGISQERLGELVGTSGQQIARLENGIRKLTQGWMEKIGPALEVEPTALMDAGDVSIATPDAPQLVKDREELAVLWFWRGLSVKARNAVIDLLLIGPTGDINEGGGERGIIRIHNGAISRPKREDLTGKRVSRRGGTSNRP